MSGRSAIEAAVRADLADNGFGDVAPSHSALLREIGDDTMADLKLALTEAVSNSVRHAYGPDGDGSVDVRYELHPDRLGIEVVDDGAGFDPDEAPSFEGGELSEGGLGIAIMPRLAVGAYERRVVVRELPAGLDLARDVFAVARTASVIRPSVAVIVAALRSAARTMTRQSAVGVPDLG